jgi:hypothetical protein
VNWTQGFHESKISDDATDSFPYNLVIIPEASGVNNTLNHRLCTAFENTRPGVEAQGIWLNLFAPPITARLNKNLPGANLADYDAVQIMDLCPFDTVASPNGSVSPFCRLFSEPEWHDYAYYQSLGKWYGYGPGNPLGSTQGVGYVNELIARLTRTPVDDHTSTNTTLDADPATFPLNRTMYADFTHDNDMTGVFAALGLYNATQPLNKTSRETPDQAGGYAASWTVPFASRMYVEKMACAGSAEELVRVLVNDRVISLQSCDADLLGRCTVKKFVDSLSFARTGGLWNQCFL